MIKKIIYVITAFFALVAGLILVLGIILPNEQTVKSEIQIKSSPEQIWKVINTPEKYPEWMSAIQKVKTLNDKEWIEYPKSGGEIKFKITDSKPFESMSIEYTMENALQGFWYAKLEKKNDFVLLKTEDKIIHKSWLGKIFMPFFFDLEDFVDVWGQELKQRAEKDS